jgi:D-3-phosphoglycerate dehydrogenase
MHKIQTFDTIAPTGLNQFPNDLYEISSHIEHPDAILVRSHDLNNMLIPHSVKAVGRAGAGLNNVPVAELTKRGIAVFNTPGANANAVRELVIAGMLLSSRNICQAWNYVLQLQNNTNELNQLIEKNKKQFVGFELMGKTLGIVGLGNIGVQVSNAAISLGMHVIGYDPTITVNRAWELSSQVKQAHNIDDLLMQADFVSFHVPLNETTKDMINESRFQIMKKNVTLLNFARDGIIHPQALISALNENKIFSYVTDFPTAELKHHPRVISLPHLGASTFEAEENCALMIAKQLRSFLEEGSITNSVNFPALQAPPISSGHARLVIVNENVPNMVAQISSKLAQAGLNITSLVNQSLHDIAYTLIDINNQITETVLKQIKSVEGVIQLRLLTQ